MKFLRSILLVLTFSLLNIGIVYAGEWEERTDGWYYIDKEYSGPRWIKEYGYWYYIDSKDKLVTNKFEGFSFNKDREDMPYGVWVEKNPIVWSEKEFNGTNYLEIGRENTEYKSIVIFLHGLGENKEAYRKYGTQMADDNSLVIIPDAYGHGKSLGSGTFAEIVKGTVKEIDDLLEYYEASGKEINILGYDMGGIIGAKYAETGKYKINSLGMSVYTLEFESLTDDKYLDIYSGGEVTGKISKERLESELKDLSIKKKLKCDRLYTFNKLDDMYVLENRYMSK